MPPIRLVWSDTPPKQKKLLTAFVFKYSKYPNAAKAYLQFMREADPYNAWSTASNGYISQPLKAYASNPIWTGDRNKHAAPRFRRPLAQERLCGPARPGVGRREGGCHRGRHGLFRQPHRESGRAARPIAPNAMTSAMPRFKVQRGRRAPPSFEASL